MRATALSLNARPYLDTLVLHRRPRVWFYEGDNYCDAGGIERGRNGASVAKLFEFADLFECGVETFLLEGSWRPSEQAERIAQMLAGLPASDRQLLVDLVDRLSARLKSGTRKTADEDLG